MGYSPTPSLRGQRRFRLFSLGSVCGAVLLLSASAAQASNGDILRISDLLAPTEVTDITLDTSSSPAGGSFWVVSRLQPGKLFRVSRDLGTKLAEIPNPHGIGALPNFILSFGIAYRPSSDTLFVMALDRGAWKVKEVNKTTGAEIPEGSFTITTPADSPFPANLRGLTYDSLNNALWYLDAANDRVVRTDFTGMPVSSFYLPADDPHEVELRGEGLCFEMEEEGARLYVAYGDIFRTKPSRLIQMTLSGRCTGIEVPLLQIQTPGIAGIQTHRVGASQRRVVVIGSGGRLHDIEQVIPELPPPSHLRCTLSLTARVQLGWENNGPGPNGAYTGSLLILRDGVPFATVAGNVTSYVDTTPQEGDSTYSLQACCDDGGNFSQPSFPCTVTVGPGGLVRWVSFPGQAPFDVASDPATGEIFVTDDIGPAGQGKIYRYDADLNLIGEIPSPWTHPGPIAFLPHISILIPPSSTLDLDNVLAVANVPIPPDTEVQVRIIDLTGAVLTTFPLQLGVPGGQLMSMTYVPPTSQFAFVELTAHRLTLVNKNGAFVDSCEPIDIFRPEDMSAGVTYDPIQDTFLTVFENGVVRELFAEFNEGLCTETQFNFRLSSLGENFGEPAAIGGIQISRNTLIVCGRSARALFQVLIFPSGPLFRRGDFNRSGGVDLSDAVATANYLFRSGPAPSCPDAADANDDGLLEISDPVFLLFYLFLQGPAPPEPFPDAGEDPTFRDNLGCEEAV